MTAPLSWINRTLDRLIPRPHSLYIHPPIRSNGGHSGQGEVASFSLGPGHWLVIAKAKALVPGGGEGHSDCRVAVLATENGVTTEDAGYGSPFGQPGSIHGATMVAMLPVKVVKGAQVTVLAEYQMVPAEFSGIVVAAIRDVVG